MQKTVKGLTLLLCCVLPARGRSASLEGFEGLQTSWRPVGGDARYRIADHRRVRQDAHLGQGCEQISLLAGNGSSIYFGHVVPQARVISELLPSVWVRSGRPGIQILARVVLPRTADPHSGEALTTILGGPATTRAGVWEQLRLEGVSRLLEQRLRVLRHEVGPHVDAREAYVDQVVLNVYTGPGATTVWIDDLDLAGWVAPAAAAATGSANRASWNQAAAQRLPPTGGQSARKTARDVRLQDTVLMVGSRPTLPRAIEHRGEPLGLLAQLGFNVVWTATTPAPALLDEADRVGLWLIGPPPNVDQLREQGLGGRFAPVLAWDLGRSLAGPEREATARWAHELGRSDPHSQRPLLGSCRTDHRAYSRILSILVAGRAPLGTSLELGDFATWLAGQPRLALPGTPVWARIQTQPLGGLLDQLRAAPFGTAADAAVDDQQIRLLSWIALAAGARGLVFDSASALTGTDAPTRRRAQALELVNLQLSLIEPWVASAADVSAIVASDPSVTGALLHSQAERARLLIPIRWQRDGQLVAGQPHGQELSLVVPGVPESNGIYEVTPVGMRRLRRRRVAGGIRIWLEQADACSVVLMTQDRLVLSSLSQRISQTGRRASQLLAALAADRLALVDNVHHRLRIPAGAERKVELLTSAKTNLQRAAALRAGGNHARAFDETRRAIQDLCQVQRGHFEHVLQGLGSPVSSPLAVSYATLPEQQEFTARLRSSRLGANRLVGGNFEDLAELRQAGWQHYQHSIAGLRAEVELTPTAARDGRFSLRLRADEDTETAPHLVATPPVWVISPPVDVVSGQLVRIHGWVRVTAPVTGSTGSVDGLLVIDSLAGEALAERIGPTDNNWTELSLYRTAPQSGTATVTFALSGYGQAEIDGVTIRPVELLPPRGQPPASAAQPPFRPPIIR